MGQKNRAYLWDWAVPRESYMEQTSAMCFIFGFTFGGNERPYMGTQDP